MTPFAVFQIFDDAYKSQLSCVVVDDIERLLGGLGWGLRCLLCRNIEILQTKYDLEPFTLRASNCFFDTYATT